MSKYVDLSQNQNYSIKHGVVGSIVGALSVNYYTVFAISVLGATDFQVGLMSSIPQLVAIIAALPAAIAVNRVHSMKKLQTVSTLLTRMSLLFIVFLPLLPSEAAMPLFIIILGLASLPQTFMGSSWQAMIAGMFPSRSRNLFFAKRNRILALVGMIATMVVGFVMKSFPETAAIPYQVMFGAAFCFGILEVYFLSKHKERKVVKKKKGKVKLFSKQVFQHKPYTVFLVCSIFMNLAWQMGWTQFNIYQVRYVEATIFWTSVFTVATQLASFFAFPIWGRLSRKHSNPVLLAASIFGMALCSTLTVVSSNNVWMVFVNIITGFFMSGITLVSFYALLDTTEGEMQSTFIANYNFILPFVAMIAPQVGIFFLEIFGVETALLITSFFRVISGLLFIGAAWYLKKDITKPNVI